VGGTTSAKDVAGTTPFTNAHETACGISLALAGVVGVASSDHHCSPSMSSGYVMQNNTHTNVDEVNTARTGYSLYTTSSIPSTRPMQIPRDVFFLPSFRFLGPHPTALLMAHVNWTGNEEPEIPTDYDMSTATGEARAS